MLMCLGVWGGYGTDENSLWSVCNWDTSGRKQWPPHTQWKGELAYQANLDKYSRQLLQTIPCQSAAVYFESYVCGCISPNFDVNLKVFWWTAWFCYIETRGEQYYRSDIISRPCVLFGKYRTSWYQDNIVIFYTIFLVKQSSYPCGNKKRFFLRKHHVIEKSLAFPP